MHLIKDLRSQKINELLASAGKDSISDSCIRGYILGLDELLNIQFEEME